MCGRGGAGGGRGVVKGGSGPGWGHACGSPSVPAGPRRSPARTPARLRPWPTLRRALLVARSQRRARPTGTPRGTQRRSPLSSPHSARLRGIAIAPDRGRCWTPSRRCVGASSGRAESAHPVLAAQSHFSELPLCPEARPGPLSRNPWGRIQFGIQNCSDLSSCGVWICDA